MARHAHHGDTIGRLARNTQPYIEQVFLRRGRAWIRTPSSATVRLRKMVESIVGESDLKEKGFFYIPSLSSRTIVYKGLLLAPQIPNFIRSSPIRS